MKTILRVVPNLILKTAFSWPKRHNMLTTVKDVTNLINESAKRRYIALSVEPDNTKRRFITLSETCFIKCHDAQSYLPNNTLTHLKPWKLYRAAVM